jgi:Zn-dependent protease with chaperone function
MIRQNPSLLLATIVLLCALSPLVRAQEAPGSSSGSPIAQSAPAETADPAISSYSQSSEQLRKALAYCSARYRHFFVNALWGILIPLIILGLRVAPWLRDWAERVSSRRFVQVVLYAPLLLLALAVLTLPSDVWDHTLERRYGLSIQGWTSWLADWVTNLIILLILATFLIWIFYTVARRSPHRWWFYFWLASIPVLLGVLFAQPMVIDPLFFQFTSLRASRPALVAELERVVQHGGIEIPPERMFEMNASSKLTGLNAYISGFGASKRAVIWDTTLKEATTLEVLFVFGHEMGHYVLFHLPKEFSIDAGLVLGLLYLGFRLAAWTVARWGQCWRIRALDDLASLPLLIFVLGLLAFLTTPAFNAVSRYFEHEADRYGLEVIHGIVPNQGRVAALFFEKSGEINLADPNPGTFVKIWFFDHPTRPERVHFAATYDPWSHGQKATYVP